MGAFGISEEVMGAQQSQRRLPYPARVVLVGGGHANVQVIKHLSQHFLVEPQGLHLTLLSDQSTAWYSGMMPGCISGRYHADQTQINLQDLADWCGATFVCAKMQSINWDTRCIHCENQTDISFDYCCINIGSITRYSELPGVRQHALLTRPISELLGKIISRDSVLNATKTTDDIIRRVVVVGSGAAGLELAWALRARVLDMGFTPELTLIHSGRDRIFDERGAMTVNNIHSKLEEHSIRVIGSAKAVSVSSSHVTLSSEREIPYDYLLWATGAQAPPVLKNLGVALDDVGYVLVNPYLQSTSHPRLFAVGDCCNFDNKNLPKAGVYSVREGPVVAENLIHLLLEEELVPYQPQEGFLSLLNTSDGEAISSWKGISFTNSKVMHLKDKIDMKFMNSFDVSLLGPSPQMRTSGSPPTDLSGSEN